MSSDGLYWITGLSGAGKSTIGKALTKKLKTRHNNVIFMDGDILREVFGQESGHSTGERLRLSRSYSRLCRMLVDQGLIVVFATISMFHEIQKWNRQHISNYMEIYLKTPMEILIGRDKNQLYRRALSGEIKNVVGVDIQIEEPIDPDITIQNNDKKNALEVANELFERLGLSGDFE